MKLVIYILGGIWILVGVFIVATPQTMISLYKKFLQAVSMKFMGLVALIIGDIIIISSHSFRYFWVFVLLGLFAQIKGAVAILYPEYATSLSSWWLNRDPLIWRILGILPAALGIMTCTLAFLS